LHEIQWFVEVTSLANGVSFGELALTNQAPRAATVQCKENCNFAVFSGADFMRIIRRMEAKAFAQKWHFLSDLNSLKHLAVEQV
jgi:CRP-like cAMP-binding protein